MTPTSPVLAGPAVPTQQPHRPSLAMLLIGNVGSDGRVQKEIITLQRRGVVVTVIQWPQSGERSGYEHLRIDVVNYTQGLSRYPSVNFVQQMVFNLFALWHLRRLDPDVVQCNDLNTLLGGFLYRRHARVIYDVHELFPESQTGLRRRVWSALERWMVLGCSGYILPQSLRLKYFASKYDLPADAMALVENFPSTSYAFSRQNRLREALGLQPETVILLCTGVLGPGRGIEQMISAIPELDRRYVLVLLGPTFRDYNRDLLAQIREAHAEERVFLLPEIPYVLMLDYINSADIGLVFYRNNNLNNYWCASNKLYEFIFCAKPVVTNDYPGLAEVVQRQGLGVCVGNLDPQVLAAAIREAEALPRRAGGSTSYTWESQEETYLRLILKGIQVR
jgi:glycosyltransferase involved in cell wall biosynthesis